MDKDAPIRSIELARVAGGLGGRVLDSARYAVDDDREIVGYALVFLYKDGTTMCGANTAIPDDVPYLNRYTFLGMCHERIREHLITTPAATDIVNRANGFDD